VNLVELTLLGTGLDGGLGDLSGLAIRLLDALDDTDGNSLSHVTDGETTERGVVGEGLDTHGLGRDHLDKASVTGFDD
jgi:hypothetical protein